MHTYLRPATKDHGIPVPGNDETLVAYSTRRGGLRRTSRKRDPASQVLIFSATGEHGWVDEDEAILFQARAASTSFDPGRVPAPCPECGWQYPYEQLVAAGEGRLTLDHNPTHPCGAALARAAEVGRGSFNDEDFGCLD